MEPQIVLRVCLVAIVLFKSTFICADETGAESPVNGTVRQIKGTATLSENITETLDNNKQTRTSVNNVLNSQQSADANTEQGTKPKEIKVSDEIIIGDFNNNDLTKTQGPPRDGLFTGNTNAVSKISPLQTTTVDSRRAHKTRSIIGVTVTGTTPSDIKLLPSTDIISKTTDHVITTTSRALVTTAIVNTSQNVRSSNPDVLLDNSVVGQADDDPEVLGEANGGLDSVKSTSTATVEIVHVPSTTPHVKSVKNNPLMHHHHIPFRHHLQLVPMEDEPFGAVILKDQRYIVSVLIPVGVGIIGAVVIMVTVYGLRQVARKHGREFPRVDIEAGRQNIASISSERTDKMLLLDDDEDNEF